MEPVSIYLSALLKIIHILSVPGPQFLRPVTAMSIIIFFRIIYLALYLKYYEWMINEDYWINKQDYSDTMEAMHLSIFLEIAAIGGLCYLYPYAGISILISIVPIILFWYFWCIGFGDTLLLITVILVLNFFEISKVILLVIAICCVALTDFMRLIAHNSYKNLYNNLADSYNLAIKDRDEAIRERDEVIEERNKLKAKQKTFDDWRDLNDYY
ncbi:hypothetical protein [Bartonella schoenbuchensis]|uniref:hypothetical protein n=1 Tax=Bartonella schoenbuchensis TaxID=165694 RepID=UPI0031451CC0